MATDYGVFTWPTFNSGGVPIYATFSAFPAGTVIGQLAVAADTGILFEWNGSAWVAIGGPGAVLSIGSPANGLSIAANVLSLGLSSASTIGALSSTDWSTFNNKQSAISIGNLDAQAGNSKGLAFVSNVLSQQSASSTNPGLVNTTTQSFAGSKEIISTGVVLTISDPGDTGVQKMLYFNNDANVSPSIRFNLDNPQNGMLWYCFYSAADHLVMELTPQGGLTTSSLSSFSGAYTMSAFGDFVIHHDAGHASTPTVILRAAAGQSADMIQFQDSAGNPLSVHNKNSNLVLQNYTTGALPTSTGAGELVYDSTVNIPKWWNGSAWTSVQSALTLGNLTDAGTDGITVTGGTGAVIGSGTSLSQHVADASHNGYLSSADWSTFNSKGSGTVTAVSVASANGLAGSSSGGATPALTLSTSITGILKGNGTAISAATSGTDYSAGTSALSTGILKSTTTTGALTIAVAGDFPTLNQNTTGTAAGLSATLAIGSGGTGQTTKAAAFDALQPMTTGGDIIYGGASGTGTRLANGSSGQVLTSAGGTSAPSWATPTAGTVTSVTFTGDGTVLSTTPSSAVTTSGTVTAALKTQTANLIFSGPASGGAANPTFRALVEADVPGAALPGKYFWAGYYPNSGVNYWSRTSTSMGDFTANGTIPSPTAIITSNFGTISKATSSLPGINFSAPRTGTIKFNVVAGIFPGFNAGTATWAVKLHESTTSTDIAFASGSIVANATTSIQIPTTLIGYFNATVSTTYNFKLQGLISAGEIDAGGATVTNGSAIQFSMEYID